MKRYAVTAAGTSYDIAVEEEEGSPGRVRVLVGGAERVIELRAQAPGRYSWLEGTKVINAEVDAGAGGKLVVSVGGQTIPVEVADARQAALGSIVARAAARPAGPATVRAPMPGRVVKVLARAGEDVKAGRGLLVVEAMKMENEVRAPRDGRVSEIRVSEGAAVEGGQELVVLE